MFGLDRVFSSRCRELPPSVGRNIHVFPHLDVIHMHVWSVRRLPPVHFNAIEVEDDDRPERIGPECACRYRETK